MCVDNCVRARGRDVYIYQLELEHKDEDRSRDIMNYKSTRMRERVYRICAVCRSTLYNRNDNMFK